ncbi:MAG: flagellar basal body rod protein FlgC [Rhodospirillaceae bacterium]|jgi:flagellar basal-body rod protein FlgC|nr:flagellar basal body rod protein FlgC [Rhodospirillaceae bacterium]MBT6116932.1 flagellar basal body rod protein FlgC [Rhodospirillaceae bacterium]
MDIVKALKISAAGMRAQGTRLRVLAENIANAESAPDTPGVEPYRRKLVSFENALDRDSGLRLVRIKGVVEDKSEFGKRYDPHHPAADGDGYVQVPNVKSLLEMMDFREAQRSYEANMSVLRVSRSMLQRTVDMLRG